MNKFWAWASKILFVVVVIESWFLYDFYQKHTQLVESNSALTTELNNAQLALAEAVSKIDTLEQRTIEGQIRQTNKAIVSGWETLLKKVENELASARKSLPSLLGGKSSPPSSEETLEDDKTKNGAGSNNEDPASEQSYPEQAPPEQASQKQAAPDHQEQLKSAPLNKKKTPGNEQKLANEQDGERA